MLIVSSSTESAFTAKRGLLPLKKSISCSAVSIAARVCAAEVEAAKCGVTIILSLDVRILSTAGSSLKTSIAAPAISPDSTAAYKASSSTKGPRAALINKAVSFIFLNSCVLSKLRVPSCNAV